MKTNWTEAKLGDVAKIVTGNTPSKKRPDFFGGEIPFVTPRELNDTDPVIESATTLTELGAEQSRIIPPESIMVCCIGSLGKVGFAGTNLVTNQQINSLIFDETKVFPRYGYYYCRTLKTYLEHIAPSTTIAIVNKSRFSEIKIPLPPLSEQKQIAEVLDKADALREKRRASIEKLDTLLQSVFLDMFGDPVKNPMGWEVSTVSSFVSSLQGGKSISSESSENNNCKYRVLKVSAVTELIYKPEESKPVPTDYAPPKEHIVQKSDLIFSRANTSELVGAVAYVWETPNDLLLPDKLWRFVWSEKCEVNPLFVFGLFTNRSIKYELGKLGTGTSGSMKNISKSKLMAMKVPLPDINLQNKFGVFVRKHKALMNQFMDNFSKTENLFQSLQQKAFKGELFD